MDETKSALVLFTFSSRSYQMILPMSSFSTMVPFSPFCQGASLWFFTLIAKGFLLWDWFWSKFLFFQDFSKLLQLCLLERYQIGNFTFVWTVKKTPIFTIFTFTVLFLSWLKHSRGGHSKVFSPKDGSKVDNGEKEKFFYIFLALIKSLRELKSDAILLPT